jgi:hypothetical protein
VIGKRGNQHAWINGTEHWIMDGAERLEMDQITPMFQTGFHPVSRKPGYIAERESRTYFVFGDQTHGPFGRVNYTISNCGNHYALTGIQQQNTVRIHDGKTVEYINKVKPEIPLMPNVDALITMSPSGRRIAEIISAGDMAFLVVDGVAIRAERAFLPVERLSFTAPEDELAYIFTDLSNRKKTRILVMERSGNQNDPGMSAWASPTGTIAYNIPSDSGRAIFFNGRIALKLPSVSSDGLKVFFSDDGMSVASRIRLGTGGVALFSENAKSLEYSEIPDEDVKFSPDGKRVAFVAYKDAEYTVVVDGNEGPYHDRSGIHQLVKPRFSTDSRVLYYETREVRNDGIEGITTFIAEGKVVGSYQKRVSDVITTDEGIGFYVLKGKAIHYLAYKKVD